MLRSPLVIFRATWSPSTLLVLPSPKVTTSTASAPLVEIHHTRSVEAVGKIDQIDRKKCLERVQENFTIDCMVAGYEKVYAEIFRRQEQKK